MINSSGEGVEWSLPIMVSAGSIYNFNMFQGTGGNFTSNPVAGTTYYVASALPPGLSFNTGADQLAAYVGESVNFNLADTIKGGTGTYTFAGTVPTGLALNPNGTVSGSIATADTYNFTLTVTDTTTPDPLVFNAEYTLTITTPDPLSASTNLGKVKVGKVANFNLADTISGGVPPYAFTYTGSLPAGFSLSGSTLSFTTAAAGNYVCGITVTDQLGTTMSPSPVYTVEAVESAGFIDDDPEEPASGVTVDCLTPNGVFPRTCNQITSSDTTWENSWYYVNDELTLTSVTVVGKVSLVLGDNAALTLNGGTGAYAGIQVTPGNILTIYVSGSGTGSLVANGGSESAGIGGNDPGGSCGKVTIYGGNITAKGGSYAAGIGGADDHGNGGTVAIYGGTVVASGGSLAAGIGGGWSPSVGDGTLVVGDNVVVKAGSSENPTTVLDHGVGGEISIVHGTHRYFTFETTGPAPLAQTTSAFDAYTGEAMSFDLATTVSGGTSPYSFALKTVELPSWLSLSGTTLSGTPTASSETALVFTVTDSGVGADNQSEDFTYTITVTQPPKTITYKDGENTINGLSPAEYAPGVGATLPTTAPAATGYELEGWYETAACDGEKVTAVSAEATDNKTFYAKWTPIVYTVTYMDGSTPITDQGLIPTSYTIESADLSLPATATKTGKGFYGWYGTTACIGDAVTTITHGSTGNKIFYAKWGAVQSNEAYVDAGGNEMPAQLCTVIASDTTTLATGWYVAKGEVPISESVTVSGDVNLILADGAHLEVTVASGSKSALNVASGNSLTIYAQANGTGRLDATGGGTISAGIGGNSAQVCGVITINGGRVIATGGTGIGSGYNFGDGDGGTVVINGGRVTATSASEFSAGIGSVKSSDNQGTLTVGANVVVKAGASSTLTDSDIKNPNGETSIPLTTIYRYYQVEKPGPTPLAQTTSAFAAYVGQAFEQSITGTISGGTAPYTFTLKSQTLSEKGLSYSDGVISGTPSATGTATVTVTVSDSASGSDHQSADFTYTVTITYPPKSITYVDSRDGTTELTGLVPAQYTPGTAATLPATATAPTGYAFAGWYATKECTGDAVTSVATTETEDKTYYAKWTPILYTITYRDGASTMSGLLPTTYTIESTDITIPTPATKTGYEFVSWHTSSLLTPASVVTTIPHGSTGNKTFYSKWSLVPVNAPYKDGNGNTAYVSSTPLETTSTSLSTGWYIATGSITIPSTVTVSGDVKLILEDGCSLTVNGSSSTAGINVPVGASLTIYAQANGTGLLTATSGSSSSAAGIGGNSGQACGTVTIYGGNITARSSYTYGAGIGGGQNGNCGMVTIYGGTVVAQAQYSTARGAGIGGGGSSSSSNNGSGGTVTIYGGTVTAESNRYGAGIGGGYYNGGATVTINGGTVTATGGSSTSSTAGYIASGIGKGYGSASSYTDGTLTVGVGMKAYVGSSANPTDELGSSRSYRYYVVKAGPLTKSVSAIKASSGEACNIDLAATVLGGSGTYTFALKAGSELPSGLEIDGTTLSGTVSAVGEYTFTLVVTDTTEPTPQTIDAEYTLTVKLPGFIDEDPEEPASGVEVDCRTVDNVVRRRICNQVESSNTAVTWDNSWYYVASDVTLSAGVTVVGKVSLVLADDATLTVTQTDTAKAGIAVTNGCSLVIYGQTKGNGALNASSGPNATSSSYNGAGIGGNKGDNGNAKGDCGNIVICGGNITARGSCYGAGIGGGYYGAGGTVTVYGGTVTATGGNYGAGIGGGQYKNGGTVTIYDGTIVANGGTNGAGIGGGNSGAGGRVDVYGGNIEATGGSGSYTVGIGRGNGSGKTNGAGLYVYNDDEVIKYSSNASYTLNPITPNATTHKVDLGTSSSYKYVRITGPIPMAQKTTSLGAALTGQQKSWTLSTSTYITEGKTPYIFDPANSTIPTGFSLTSAGVLSGRPSSAGNYEFDIAVTDSNPSSTNFTFTLTVSDPNPITVATTDYGSITKGTYFYQTIQPTGGVSPYTFSAVQAELPPGITCYTEAGVGVLSGTCNTPGDYEFTVTVTDAALPANVQPIAFHLEIKDVYPITYYDEGGVETLSLNPATYVQDAGLATLPTPVKEGSAFLNWYDNAGLHGAPVTSIPATSTGPVALYSKWYTPVSGNIEVTFTGASGTPQTETCTVITPSMAAYDSSLLYNNAYSNITLSSGWYVVANVDTLPQKVSIVINGEVNLVLMDDRSLTVTKPANHKSGNCMSGIVLLPGNTLNIYGQTKGNGTLTATGFNSSAGIGGYDYSPNKACGTLKIYGGTVVANGGSGAAGIGGSASADGAGGTVEIYGGTVTATGSNGGAGIGSGGNSLNSGVAANGGTVKIYGGTVTATGSAFSYSGPRVGAGAGIGGGGGAGKGGNGGTVEIYNGVVTAIGGSNDDATAAGIGGGNGADSEGTLKVSGQYAVVYAGDDASSATERTPGANDMVALDGSPYYEIQGEGAAPVTYNITYMSAGESQYWLEPNNYTHGTAQTLATPDPREGYTFDGWFVDDQFNGDPVVEVPANATGDKTFYAKWTPVVYTITYYSIVGDEKTEITSLAPATYTTESGATLPTEISVVREGWVFDGWASYTSGPQITGIEPGTTGNKTFYVRWDVSDFGLFDGEIYLDACFEDEVDLADTIHKGTDPYTFALKAGEELPTGLTLESDGTLSGTPTAAGIYDVVITVTDSSEPKRTIDAIYTIEVMLSKTTGISGADATVAIGFPVEIDLAPAIRGGTAPYSFEVATDLEGNALPSGLVLNGNTLEGTSTMRGNAFFALNVTDSKGYSSYLYYTIYSQSDSAQRTDTVNGIEWGYVSSSLPKQAGRLSVWNSSSLASDGMHAISANTEGCVYVPDGSCLWTGREPVTCIGRNAFKNCDKIT
ncbi:MAG: InlB B-repeat-containing protein, partial [Kiritimatiellae bacterium]|nr:InlB B-repeat-containing protein [Kiritimatiellia bacterium]